MCTIRNYKGINCDQLYNEIRGAGQTKNERFSSGSVLIGGDIGLIFGKNDFLRDFFKETREWQFFMVCLLNWIFRYIFKYSFFYELFPSVTVPFLMSINPKYVLKSCLMTLSIRYKWIFELRDSWSSGLVFRFLYSKSPDRYPAGPL